MVGCIKMMYKEKQRLLSYIELHAIIQTKGITRIKPDQLQSHTVSMEISHIKQYSDIIIPTSVSILPMRITRGQRDSGHLQFAYLSGKLVVRFWELFKVPGNDCSHGDRDSRKAITPFTPRLGLLGSCEQWLTRDFVFNFLSH